MRITKTGRDPKKRKWCGECRACGAEADATESEMTHVTIDQREGGSFSWEVCPSCGAGERDAGYGGILFYPCSNANSED